jgi:hypothetical protein
MANGLIGGFGSFGQAQGQTQGNLLGGVFQQQPTRGELRRGLLSDLVQQYGGNAQQTGGAAIGAGLGIGISKLLGRDVQGAERADKIRRVQQQVNSQFGDQFASDPYSAFTGTAQALFDEGLIPEANAALQQAANYKPEPQKRRITVTGGTPEAEEISNQLEGRTFSVELTGNRVTGEEDITTEDDESRFTAKNIRLGGQTVIGQVDDDTGRVFYNGQDVTNQATFAPRQVEQGEPGEFNLEQKQEFDLREARVTAQNYANTAEDAINLIQEYPDINTWVGEAASVVNNVQAEAKALARASGVEFDESILDPSNYSSQFDDLGIQNERLQGLITNLSLQAAAASGQTGRAVSDKDMVRFIGEVGANARDPRAFAQTLSDSVNRTVRNLRTRSRELYGEDLGEGITFRGQPTGFTQSEIEQRQSGVSRDQALEKLPDGATLGKRNEKTGAWEVYQDGKIIGEIQPD